MRIFIFREQPDGTFVKQFYAISELETIIAHKRAMKGKRLQASAGVAQRKQPCGTLQKHST